MNTASGDSSTIGGGRSNTALGATSAIGGGQSNTASADCSTIPGGCFNTASGINSFATGRNARAVHANTFVYGTSNGPTTTSIDRQAIFNLSGINFTPPFPMQPVPVSPTFYIVGNLEVTGAKNFMIDHPILENKFLRHTCVEAPKPRLMYEGTIQLINGKVDVDIDATANMTDGTFEKLTTNARIHLTNTSNWDMVKIENRDVLLTGKFTIISNNIESNAIVDWLVIADRNGIDIDIEIDKPEVGQIEEHQEIIVENENMQEGIIGEPYQEFIDHNK